MKIPVVATMLVALFCIGCSQDSKSATGFVLPDGSVERGQEAFVQLGCQACHTVSGVTFKSPELESEEKIVALGGEKTRVQTYGDLVTSIINPSHRFARGYPEEQIASDGESKMQSYNEKLTIQQLIDLVTFLETHYSVKVYDTTDYAPYLY